MTRRTMALFIVLCIGGLSPVLAEILFERFDLNHSTIGFVVPILGGLSEVEGKFTDFSITLRYDEADLSRSSITVVIQTASITTGIEQRDKHLRSPDFFDVASHPEIRFESSKIEKRGDGWVALGTLQMRGTSKKIELPFTIKGLHENPEKKKVLIGLSAGITLNRQDYGVAWTHPAVPLFVSDEIRIDIRLISKQHDREPAEEDAD